MAKARIQIGYADQLTNNATATAPPTRPTSKLSKTSPTDNIFLFSDVALLLSPTDSVAVATLPLKAGDQIQLPLDNTIITISHNVLEGHRFAIREIAAGQPVLSWGYSFGRSICTLQPGTYLVNDKMIDSLLKHGIPASSLPPAPNFVDEIVPYHLETFQDCQQVPRDAQTRAFNGYVRTHGRGTGTRNYILILGTSAASRPFVEKLGERFQKSHKYKKMLSSSLSSSSSTTKTTTKKHGCIDGIIAVSHTEGVRVNANNHEQTVRVLAGYATHQNVAAVLLVDLGEEYEAITADTITTECQRRFPTLIKNNTLSDNNPLPVHHVRLTGDVTKDLATCERLIVTTILPSSYAIREPCPVSQLFLAQQCGGSDAFSGVSANPITGDVAERIVRQGGGAILAESDELIGAEAHILSKCRNRSVAQKFLYFVQNFKQRMKKYGQSAEQNPSGGNNLRGIYNITLKSVGAGMKKSKNVRLDHVLKYGEHVNGRDGYFFMDSPGNDLESTAGQCASGCNMIVFTTGNGAVTNHPLCPTIKVITTTRRYALVGSDMDFNAGRLTDGGNCKKDTVESLGEELYEMMLEFASGKKTKGELHGHSGTQLWRDWQSLDEVDNQKDVDGGDVALELELFHGRDLEGHHATILSTLAKEDDSSTDEWESVKEVRCVYYRQPNGVLAVKRIGLVLPTSLCSSQVCLGIVEQLNAGLVNGEEKTIHENTVSSFLTLQHSEGCGVGSANGSEEIEQRILVGHLTHSSVDSNRTVLLEHGCEKLHNSYFEKVLAGRGHDASNILLGSVQLDGGLNKVTQKILLGIGIHDNVNTVDSTTKGSCNVANVLWQEEEMSLLSPGLTLGLMYIEPNSNTCNISAQSESLKAVAAEVASRLLSMALRSGVNVILPTSSGLYDNALFLDSVLEIGSAEAGLAFGQQPSIAKSSGNNGTCSSGCLFVMDARGVDDSVELVTGLAASGCHMIVMLTSRSFVPQHPMVPVTAINPVRGMSMLDVVKSMRMTHNAHRRAEDGSGSGGGGDCEFVTAFQITRGLLSVSV